MTSPLISLQQVSKRFGRQSWYAGLFAASARSSGNNVVHAVDNVTLEVLPGEALGIVGESGCGKSTLGRIAAGLIEPDDGDVRISGERLAKLPAPERKQLRRHVQMIFQSAIGSLNPRQRIGQILEEPLKVYDSTSSRDRRKQVRELLARVGLSDQMIDRYPNQLSGGQCQRVGIARALTVNPEIIICDEPVSALDVSVQAQILNLFQDLRESMGISYLFISHDLSVVERVSDRVAVMYLGKIVEEASTADLFSAPMHPYTIALLEAAPTIGKTSFVQEPVRGERPSPYARPEGCSFHPRCPFAMEICRKIAPVISKQETGRSIACHLHARSN